MVHRSAWRAAFVLSVLLVSSGRAQTPSTLAIDLDDASQWRFLGGDWERKDDGVVYPPNRMHLHSRAFYVAKAFDDVTVEFDYFASYRDNGEGNAGLILRAQDGRRFYWVQLPWGGQAYRAKNYWAAVGVLNGDEYVRNVKLAYVPNVPSETDRWYHVKVVAVGPRIRVWVDGRRALDVTDDTYRSGFIGLAGYGYYGFRNIRVQGEAVDAPAWDDRGLAKAWLSSDKTGLREPAVELPELAGSHMPTACIAPNGDVLVAGTGKMIRSTDKGRTWEPAVDIHPNLGDLDNTQTRALARLQSPYLTVIPAESPISTYALLGACDKVLTFGSSVGIEAVYWGKPSVLAGLSFYRDLGGVYRPGTHGELMELLRADLEPAGVESALMFGHFFATFGTPHKHYRPDGIFEGTFKGMRVAPDPLSQARILALSALLPTRIVRKALAKAGKLWRRYQRRAA